MQEGLNTLKVNTGNEPNNTATLLDYAKALSLSCSTTYDVDRQFLLIQKKLAQIELDAANQDFARRRTAPEQLERANQRRRIDDDDN